MNEVAAPSSPPRPDDTASPPPKCVICLGSCTDKSFSVSCMHQFCFACLLKWSKIKRECPLCKQPIKSIIHNVKSNEVFDEHNISNNPPEGTLGMLDNNAPPALLQQPQSRPTIEPVEAVNSNSNNETERSEIQQVANVIEENDQSDGDREPTIAIEILLKRKRQSREKSAQNKKRPSNHCHSSNTTQPSSTNSDSSDSGSPSDTTSRRRSKKRIHLSIFVSAFD